MTPPLVSVIMATYNRSNILPYSVQCVLSQTLTDWELLVVGDACTDDTEAMMGTFTDQRIRFINLPQNVGEQSGPNNVGLKQARGTYLAFLNHDDFWFPDHLQTAITHLTATKTDLSIGMGVIIDVSGAYVPVGFLPDDRYVPNYFIPASGWVFRRTVLATIPGWRSYRNLLLYPSHDFLDRLFRAGFLITPTNRLTWVVIPSGNRANSYRHRLADEHAHYFAELTTNPNWRTELLTTMLRDARNAAQGGWPVAWQGLKNAIKAPLIRHGIITIKARLTLTYLRKGNAFQNLRQVRGLPKLP